MFQLSFGLNMKNNSRLNNEQDEQQGGKAPAVLLALVCAPVHAEVRSWCGSAARHRPGSWMNERIRIMRGEERRRENAPQPRGSGERQGDLHASVICRMDPPVGPQAGRSPPYTHTNKHKGKGQPLLGLLAHPRPRTTAWLSLPIQPTTYHQSRTQGPIMLPSHPRISIDAACAPTNQPTSHLPLTLPLPYRRHRRQRGIEECPYAALTRLAPSIALPLSALYCSNSPSSSKAGEPRAPSAPPSPAPAPPPPGACPRRGNIGGQLAGGRGSDDADAPAAGAALARRPHRARRSYWSGGEAPPRDGRQRRAVRSCSMRR
jgi:hypothetical protein